MKEPSIVLGWKAEGEARMLLHILERRFTPLAEELMARIRATTGSQNLEGWADFALTATTLDQFRQEAGL
jgi:hypothetical protein